jgi:hypothetical protein
VGAVSVGETSTIEKSRRSSRFAIVMHFWNAKKDQKRGARRAMTIAISVQSAIFENHEEKKNDHLLTAACVALTVIDMTI